MPDANRRAAKIIVLAVIIATLAGGLYIIWLKESRGSVNSFEDCVAADNPVMTSYPEQCNHNGRTFVNPGHSL